MHVRQLDCTPINDLVQSLSIEALSGSLKLRLHFNPTVSLFLNTDCMFDHKVDVISSEESWNFKD